MVLTIANLGLENPNVISPGHKKTKLSLNIIIIKRRLLAAKADQLIYFRKRSDQFILASL